jgi:hypothetical protein
MNNAMMETFRNFFQSIPNKIKAIYLVWFLIHLILYLASINVLYHSFYERNFYPFLNNEITFDIAAYDYSEFFIYLLSPIFIYAIIYLWKKK